MISEITLQHTYGSVVLNRARSIQARGGVFERTCQYKSGLTLLEASVESASTPYLTYSAHAWIDEGKGRLANWSCSCPVGTSGYSPCKHVIAMVLDFNRNPDRYSGHSTLRYSSTTPCLSEYLDQVGQRADGMPLRADAGDGDEDDAGRGDISLELTLSRSAYQWDARFRLIGPRGEYVIKSIGEFCRRVSEREYYSYGKRLAFTHAPEAFDERSRKVVEFLRRAESARQLAVTSNAWRRGYYASSASSVGRDLHLSMIELADLIDLYAGAEILFDDGESYRDKPRSLRVLDGDPQIGLEIKPLENGAYELVRTGSARFIDCEDRLFAWDDQSFYRCTKQLSSVGAFLARVFGSRSEHILLSKSDVPRFAATTLAPLQKSIGAKAPAELEKLRPRTCRIAFYLDRDRRGVTCSAWAAYGDARINLLTGTGEGSEWSSIVRDPATEARGMRALRRHFSLPQEGLYVTNDGLALIPADREDQIATLAFDGTKDLALVGDVFTTPAFDRIASARKPSVSVGLSIKSDLINLSISASDLPQDELFALLSSYHHKKRFHRLRDGSFVDLGEVDLSRADNLVNDLGITARQLAEGTATLPSYRAFLLEEETDKEEQDESFRRYVERFHAVDPASYAPPASLVDILRPYQVIGFQWLSSLVDMGFGGILADEMGLGKSLQLISLLLDRRAEAAKIGPSLIVCPASLVYNWVAEFETFAPDIDVVPVAGSAYERQRLRDEPGHEVLVTSYELLRRDIEDYARMHFWSETLDEAQFIKNHTTLAARSVKKVNANHRFALTGTPVENRLSELWSIFDFLMPGFLGSYQRFRDRFEQPILAGDEDASARLRRTVSPFILRRLKSDVLTDLPDKIETAVLAHLEGEQADLYAAHEQRLRLSLTKQTEQEFGSGKLAVLAELTRLRQICCDPRLLYDDYRGPSAKLDAIVDLIGSVMDSQQKMLVFSQFTSYLDLIIERLDKERIRYYRIDGSTPKRRRLDLVNAFNADDTPVFLISLKAGGTGLNLTGASVVIHADPWWNAAAQNQATDRAHRIGQTRNVTVYKVIAKGTIEERIVRLQQEKSDLAEQVMGGERTSISTLTKDDLIDLLSD